METLEEVTVIRAPIERCFDLARSVEAHLAANVHWGGPAVAISGVTSGLIGPGERVTWRARHFGMRQKLTSEITAMERPVYFRDAMLRGTFRTMNHDHYFRSLSPAETEMKDVFRFAAPLGLLGRIAEISVLRRYMRLLLPERNAVIREIAESGAWRQFLPVENTCGGRHPCGS